MTVESVTSLISHYCPAESRDRDVTTAPAVTAVSHEVRSGDQ